MRRVFGLLLCTAWMQTALALPTADLVIRQASVIDGTGQPARLADIVINQGSIVAIGSELSRQWQSTHTIDATGMLATPGFIDLHAHGNLQREVQFKNVLAMGVTTLVLGQDGASPIIDDFAAWRDDILGRGLWPNVAMFVGHGSMRAHLGIEKDAPSAEQMQAMEALLQHHLAFCFGMSTGLEYVPGLFAQAEELERLAKVVGDHQGMIASHLRNEDDEALDASIDELLAQGRFAPVHISHLKSVYGKGNERAQQLLSKLYQAREAGIRVTADVYPYMASYTGIAILFPDWAKTTADFAHAREHRRAELRDYLTRKVNSRNGPDATLLGTGEFKGKTLEKLALEHNRHFADVLIDVIGPQGAAGAYFVMDEALQYRLIQGEGVAISSDGSPGSYHPRGYGSFAKLIEILTLEKGLFSLPEAIYKVTGLPASILGLTDRGLLKPGMAADLLLFEPTEVRALANYLDPHQLAMGFRYVLVNGEVTLHDGQFTRRGSGKILTPAR
ncbi:amidohydrolase family protein [Lacimicrobium sp. SS2-24]|uniref:N-acyl-D-amino-acid deacylase family protein n=1 Tax=Lacimicrobium sp. SS2-24 TaxID=2005569 RepID=UPI000B4BCDF9|nr:amidohydrolase family protein [Lacimicrobium sp. SS2-24]